MNRRLIAFIGGALLLATVTLSTTAHAVTPVVPAPGITSQGDCEDGACYYWVGGDQYATASGASVSITQADPVVGVADSHSLAEMAIESSNEQQIIEVGWSVAPEQWGDTQPHLWVFHWINSDPTCYDGCGFVAVKSSTPVGSDVTVGATGTFKMAYSGSKWVVTYDGHEIGYFPESLWGGDFTSLGLVQVFGEVAAGASTTQPSSQMGDGVLGTQTGSALISAFSLDHSTSKPSLSAYDLADGWYNYGNAQPKRMRFGGPVPS